MASISEERGLMKHLLFLCLIFIASSCTPRYVTPERFENISFGTRPLEVRKLLGLPDEFRETARGKEYTYKERISYGKNHSIQREYILIFSNGKLVDKMKNETKETALEGAEF